MTEMNAPLLHVDDPRSPPITPDQPSPLHCRLFKGLPALWARQIPYTMVKFGAFENVVQVGAVAGPPVRWRAKVRRPMLTHQLCIPAGSLQVHSPKAEGERHLHSIWTAATLHVELFGCAPTQARNASRSHSWSTPHVSLEQAECTKTEQLGVSFVAGYIAGIACATISQPADNLVRAP